MQTDYGPDTEECRTVDRNDLPLHRIVAVTPAGRRAYLEILLQHMLLQGDGIEWHLWDNCRKPEDRAYIEGIAAAHDFIRIVRCPDTDGKNRSINQFYHLCNDPDTFYVKLDDDIVWMEPGVIHGLYARAAADAARPVFVSPLVINNAVCAALMRDGAGLSIIGPLRQEAKCQLGWKHPGFAVALHRTFLGALESGHAGRFHTGRAHDLPMARFSINCIGFFGSDVCALGTAFCPLDVDDELWITEALTRQTGRIGRVYGDLVVSHFAFYTQEAALLNTDTLDRYRELVGVQSQEKPPTRRLPLIERLEMAWIAQTKQFSISLK
jgi:hypothetical protein